MKVESCALVEIVLIVQCSLSEFPYIPQGDKWVIHKMSKEIAFLCNHFQLPLSTEIQVSAKREMSCDKVKLDRWEIWACDEKRTGACFNWHDKCRKTRCGFPYKIKLNDLKYIFPQRSFFSPASILVIFIATSASLLGTRTKEFMEILFLQEMCRIFHHNPCFSEQACLFLGSREATAGRQWQGGCKASKAAGLMGCYQLASTV